MSYPTTATFVHEGDWSAETRAHPAMNWMEWMGENIFEPMKFDTPWSDIYVPEFELQKSDGTIISGGEKAWEELRQMYTPFAAYRHVPKLMYVSETSNGWRMFGQADFFVQLHGSGASAKVKDNKGKEWDASAPSAFLVDYVKDPSGRDGIKISKTHIYSDPLPVIGVMVKRGLVKPEDLMK